MRAHVNRFWKSFLAILTLCLGFGLSSGTALADEGAGTVYYRECSYDENQKKVVNTINSAPRYTVVTQGLTEFADGRWYVVTNTAREGDYYTYAEKENKVIRSIKVADNGTANLILLDGSYWRADGIVVNEGSTLNIYAGSRDASSIGEGGELYCPSDSGCAGIGGGGQYYNDESLNHNCGTVNIHGGTITAIGNGAAGIGSSKFRTPQTLANKKKWRSCQHLRRHSQCQRFPIRRRHRRRQTGPAAAR